MISRPTRRKNTAIRPSLIQCRIESGPSFAFCPEIDRRKVRVRHDERKYRGGHKNEASCGLAGEQSAKRRRGAAPSGTHLTPAPAVCWWLDVQHRFSVSDRPYQADLVQASRGERVGAKSANLLMRVNLALSTSSGDAENLAADGRVSARSSRSGSACRYYEATPGRAKSARDRPAFVCSKRASGQRLRPARSGRRASASSEPGPDRWRSRWMWAWVPPLTRTAFPEVQVISWLERSSFQPMYSMRAAGQIRIRLRPVSGSRRRLR